MLRRAKFLGLLGGLVACSSPVEPECQLNSDCPKNVLCTGGQCLPECRESRDCPGDGICVVNRCVQPDPVTPYCVTAQDCDAGQVCQAGLCGTVGLLGQDAGAEAGSDGGLDAGGFLDGSPGDGGFDGGADGGGDGGALLPYGAVCVRGVECASNLCLGPAGAPSGRCTVACSTDAMCFYPDRCVAVPGAGQYCGPATTGRATGEACPGGPTECATGLCVTPPNSGPICTHQCSPLPSCPPSLACAPVPDGQGGAVALCLPGSGAGFGELCSSAAQCASNLCVGLTGGTGGACTSFCDQVPCPLGWTCSSVGNGAGGTVQVCGPGSAQGAPFGAACNGASECQSRLCVADARTGAAYCTQLCTGPSDCAQVPGLYCALLASGEQVCAPL